MIWFTKKTRRFADAPSSKLRLESLEERQLLTAVGWEGAVANEQVPYGPEFRVEGERAETGAIDLASVQNEDAPLVTTANVLWVTTESYTGGGSLSEALNNAVSGDTIKFDASLGGKTIYVGAGISIYGKSLTIDASEAPGGITISGGYGDGEVGGGRVFSLRQGANIEIIGAIITGGSGGFFVNGSTLTLKNSIITENVADSGGAIFAYNGSSVNLINTTVAGNYASDEGGAFYIYYNTTLTMHNSIVANNRASNHNNVYYDGDWSGIDDSNLIEGDDENLVGVFRVAPEFSEGRWEDILDFEPEIWRHNENGDVAYVLSNASAIDLRLADGSPAIDAGNDAYAAGLATDLAGKSRICGASVDRGAYEYYPEDASTIVTTSKDVVDKQDGLISLREAITVYAASGDAVSFADSVKTISLTDEIAINKNLTIDATGVTIDANGGSRIFSVAQGSAVEIDGGTFINGKADSLGSSENGGAIYNSGDLTLNGSTFENNVATKNGGAIFNDVDAKLTVDGGSYLRNKARNGGAFANYGTMTISGGTTISNNDAERFGGAYFGCGSLEVGGESTVTFSDNTAGYDKDGNVVYGGAKGGAIYNDVNKSNGSVNLTGNVVFSGNKATERGGAIQTYSTLTIKPDTDREVSFENNSALKYGGAIDVGANGSATIDGKASFTGNTAPDASGVDGFGGAIFSVAELTFKGGTYEFSGNVAAKSGGAIDACAGTLTLAGTFDFSANQALGEYDDDDSDDPETKTGVGGAIATAAKTTVTEGSQFTFTENVAKHGVDVAIDTTEEGNQDNAVNAAPDKFGVGVDYATIAVMRETLPSPAAPLLPDKFVSNAAWATITVEGATAQFGAEGVAPQQLGLGAGTYDALIQCANADGETCAVYSLVLTVDAGASVEVRETTIADGRGVKFDFNLTKKDGRAVSVWEISWGDGSTSRFENLSRSQTAAHYYAQDGTFDVSLKVVYLDGASETFDAFSTQTIGASVAKTEALSAIFEEVDDLFEDAFVEFENPSVYGPAFLR